MTMPPVTTGLALFLDADQISGVTTDGTAVSAWNDLSSNAFSLAQSTSGRQPVFHTARTPSGMPAVVFDGADDRLVTASSVTVGTAAGITILAVAKRATSTDYDAIVSKGNSNWDQWMRSDGLVQLDYGGTQGLFNSVTGIWTDTAAFHLLSTACGASGDAGAWMYFDGSAIHTDTGYVGAETSGPLYVGSRPDDVTLLDGEIAAILIYDRKITGTERTTLESWLTTRYFTPPTTDVTTEILLEWSATTDLGLTTTSVITDDDDAWQIPLEWSCLVELEAPEPDESTAVPPVPFIQRVSLTMPAPTLVNGRPDSTWLPTVDRSDWGRLHLSIGGASFTRNRGMRFLPLITAYEEPFGDAEASFALPGLTDFDNFADFGINRFDPVRLFRVDTGGTQHTLYEGEVASREANQGYGAIVHTIGTLFRTDLLKEPPTLFQEEQDFGRIIARAFNDKRRRFALRIGEMAHVTTGISGVPNRDFQPFLTGAIQDYLSQMTTDDGAQWTVHVQRPRTPKLVLKDLTTVNWTVSHGAPGVDTSGLSNDWTTGITAVYGTGANGHCTWMGARFPNETQGSAPAFPLAVGATFVAGDGQAGFAPFAAYLRRGQYGTIVSDDTYDSRDVDNVEQFQERAGLTADGAVGGQTWTAAFLGGYNQGSERGAYVDTIYELPATRKRLYNAQGADVGPDPAFDPTVPRIEEYIPFGDNVSKNDGRRSGKQLVHRAHPVGIFGTLVLSSDPSEGSRFDIRHGHNIELDNFHGSSVLLHVNRAEIDWRAMTVTCTVDEKARDKLTFGAIEQRQRDVSDLTRRQRFGRTRSKVFDDYGTWLCEDGAGEIPLMTQEAGKWNVQRVAAGPKGTLARISLALGTGLTEHLLNVNLSDNPTATIPGAGRGVMAIFAKPVTANALANLLGNPTQFDVHGLNPWDREADTLAQMGMIFAAGGPGNQIGFYPNGDPGDGTDTNLTGRFEDAGGVTFGPTGRWHLWVVVYTTAACKAGGRIFPGPPG